VSYFASAGAAWIPPVVATLTREFPDLRVDLRLLELADEQQSPPDVEIFVEGAASSSVRGYDVHPLLEEPYVAVLPGDHRLAGRDAIPLRELADEPWVDNDFSRGPCRQAVLDACSSVGFSPGFHVETHDYPTAISFVAAGVGITVLPRLGIGAITGTGSTSENTVAELMREQHLVAGRRRRRRGWTKSSASARKAPDLVKRDFSLRVRPDETWVGDLKRIPTDEGPLWLATVLDLHSRRIVGFALSAHHDTDLAKAALCVAIAIRGGTVRGVIFHTDQGGEGVPRSEWKMQSLTRSWLRATISSASVTSSVRM
jgi:hypothetical protein